jgi:subtilisin family serine protease
VSRTQTPLVVVAAAWLLAACGGADAPGAAGDSLKSGSSAATSRITSAHRVPAPAGLELNRLDMRLRGVKGPIAVWVSLDQNSVAGQRAALAAATGLDATAGVSVKSDSRLQQGVNEHRLRIRESQAGLSSRLSALGAKELARVQTAHNAIAVRIDASQLAQVAALQGVAKVRPVLDYKLDLSETVPYVGGTAVQASGKDGTGVTVAVIDSGIDYTHRNLGGAGTLAAYAAAYGADPSDPKNTTRDGLFPTAKVVNGYDFVGEVWPDCPTADDCRSEDDDPIDFQGHGTHVADIIAGKSNDGLHKGMAPGAKLVGIRVCSAVATACNGIALLKAMDYALDPNGDGNTRDAVDVINMSLGSDYGQIEDDLSLAASEAVKLGVVVVTSAGNGSNKPYVVGSPSIAPGVISVAQTQVPGAEAIPLLVNAPAAIAGVYGNTATVEWAPVGGGVTGDVTHVGRGCPTDGVTPEDPYLTSPSGKIALIDRGFCSVSLKVDRAVKAGATGVLIGLVAPGDAVSFSYGGGDSFAPTLVIQQSLSSAIKARLAASQTVNVSISPASGIPLVGSMASTSSRGPSMSFQTIKPEIGAPGASLSAEVGTGDVSTAFGGTSGAAPMVSGAVALMLQAHPHKSPAQIKAMLMNSAETVVYTNPALNPGLLAPITRIGAGELRVDRAIRQTAIAWNRDNKSAALSFGAIEASEKVVLEQTLRVENLGFMPRRFNITPSFRYADDEAGGAVKVMVKSSVHVGAFGREDIDVKLVIDPTKLASWTLNGGALGGNGAALNGPEIDGYLTLTAGAEKISVPWHVLPRKAAETDTQLSQGGNPGPSLKLRNKGVESGDYDVFSLTGVGRKAPRGDQPKPGESYALVDLRAVGVRHLAAADWGADYLEFAISTFGRRAHPNYPAEFDIYIDSNNDGVDDYVVFNTEVGGYSASGQNAVYIANLATGAPATAVFYTDADLNSGNVIFTVPMNSSAGGVNVGVAPGATMRFSVYAFDNYFTGSLTDALEGMVYTPGSARFGVVGDPFGSVAPNGTAQLGVATATLPDTVSSELGLLMMYRRNAGTEADILRVR